MPRVGSCTLFSVVGVEANPFTDSYLGQPTETRGSRLGLFRESVRFLRSRTQCPSPNAIADATQRK